jgi:hypothetical protein
VFAGKILLEQNENDYHFTVADYGIQKNSTVMLGIRLEGGS